MIGFTITFSPYSHNAFALKRFHDETLSEVVRNGEIIMWQCTWMLTAFPFLG